MKKIILLTLAVIMFISIFSAQYVYSDTSDSAILAKIEDLCDKLENTYFTKDRSTGCGKKSSGHSCANCLTSNVVQATWFKNMFGDASTSSFANSYGKDVSYTRAGYSCAGFANFAEWYIFKSSNSDVISTTKIGTYDFNYNNISKYAKIGDILRLNNSHSVIYISASASGINVLDSNFNGTYNCMVDRHNISYDSYSYFTISRATDRQISPEEPEIHKHSYSKYYETAHLHREYMRCDCGDWYYTGNYGVKYYYESAHLHKEYCVCVYDNCEYNYSLTGKYGVKTNYESVHPHREYYICPFSCSYDHTYTGKNVILSSCSECTTSEKATNVVATSSGSTIHVTWDASSDATSYDVYLVQSPWGWEDIKYSHSVKGQQSCYFYNVADGEYNAFVIARPNPDTAQSNWAAVSVDTSQTDAPIITIPTSEFGSWFYEGDTITISWDKVDRATEYIYYLSEYPEGYAYTTNTANGYTSNNYISFNNLKNGHYSIFVHAINSAGVWSGQSNWLSFDVYKNDYIPTVVEEYNGHLYAIYDYEMSWTFASDLSSNLSGYLCTINDSNESDFINTLISKGNKDRYWLGARTNYFYDESNNDFQWITEETFDFTNWIDGEPNCDGEKGEKEAFLEIIKSYGYKWNDVSNTNCVGSGFVLEIDISKINSSKTLVENNNTYHIYDYPLTWTEANAFCKAQGGHLVEYNSEDEFNIIRDCADECDKLWYYVGARKTDNKWLWSNGKEIYFSDYMQMHTYYDEEGHYLMQYMDRAEAFSKFAGIRNVYQPIIHHKKNLGFICEIENTHNCIYYELNGGSTCVQKQYKLVNENITISNVIPHKENYNFLGWSENQNGAVKYKPGDKYTKNEDITLYAIWEKSTPYTEVTKIDNNNYSVELFNLDSDCNVIFATYKGEKLVKIQSDMYVGYAIPFTVSGDIDTIKVMVWDDLSTLKPLCKVEEITNNNFIIE